MAPDPDAGFERLMAAAGHNIRFGAKRLSEEDAAIDAEDVRHDNLAALLARDVDLDNPKAQGYIHKVVSTRSYNVLRDRHRHGADLVEPMDPAKVDRLRDETVAPVEDEIPLEVSQRRADLLAMIDMLPWQQRRVILAKYVANGEELTSAETGSILHISDTNVTSNLYRALANLRNSDQGRSFKAAYLEDD